MGVLPEGLKCAGSLVVLSSCILIPACLLLSGINGVDITFFTAEDWSQLIKYGLVGIGIIGIGYIGQIAENLSKLNENKNVDEQQNN